MMVHSESEIIWKRRNTHFITPSYLFNAVGQCKVSISQQNYFLSFYSNENVQHTQPLFWVSRWDPALGRAIQNPRVESL